MGAHMTNRKVVTGNRKDQQRALKRSWTFLEGGGSYLQAEQELRQWNKDRLSNPNLGVPPTIEIDPEAEAEARGLFGARAQDFVRNCYRCKVHGLGRRRKTKLEE